MCVVVCVLGLDCQRPVSSVRRYSTVTNAMALASPGQTTVRIQVLTSFSHLPCCCCHFPPARGAHRCVPSINFSRDWAEACDASYPAKACARAVGNSWLTAVNQQKLGSQAAMRRRNLAILGKWSDQIAVRSWSAQVAGVAQSRSMWQMQTMQGLGLPSITPPIKEA